MKRIGDWDIEWLKNTALPNLIKSIKTESPILPIMAEVLISALTELQERRATETVSDLEKLTGQKWGRE